VKNRHDMTLSCRIDSASEVRKQSTCLAMNKFTETSICMANIRASKKFSRDILLRTFRRAEKQ
jgi:hypothetical protein